MPFALDVLHRDDEIVVVDKPHFLATIPRGRHVVETALVRLRPTTAGAVGWCCAAVLVAPTVLFTGRSPEAAFASYNDGGVAFSYPRSNRPGAVVNVTATWHAFERASLFLEARNLGNSRFEPANGFATPGRSVLVGTRFAL